MHYSSFSSKQRLAMTWWKLPGSEGWDALICDGAIRSGKTLAMTLGFFLWSMSSFRGQTFALCGRTVSALRRNLVRHLGQWLEGIYTFRENLAENKLIVRDAAGSCNCYYLFGGQDESAYKSVQGITLAGALLDETVLMPRSFVEQVCARCSEPGSRLWFSCNPEGPEHWFYKTWICQAREKKALYLHFTMDDNPSLAEAIRERYRRMYDGVFYRRYILGQWVVAEGLIYRFDPAIHISDRAPGRGRWYISVDYGTRNPFSAGLWCVENGKALRVKEYYYDSRATGVLRTDQEHWEALVALAGNKPVEQVIIDPSAASFIALVRKSGLFSVRKAKNDVLPGIRLVTRLLREGKLAFHPECRNCIREFGLYRWEEGEERPVKQEDHAMDEIRYFCAGVMGNK